MKIIFFRFILILLVAIFYSCHSNSSKDSTEINSATPVTVTGITEGMLSQTIELSATSTFLQKTMLKSSTTGYISNLKIKQGDFVNKGETLFTLKTKEATSLGNTINKVDSSFHFNGIISVRAPVSGYISELNHTDGDFVQEGEQIVVVNDASSFAFVMNIPYEQIYLLKNNSSLLLHLPDGTNLNGTIDKAMPTVDSASQTQKILLRVHSSSMIPEKLIARVVLIKTKKENAITLPKDAVLTNETQDEFWVMKMVNDSTAVKTTIEKGMEENNTIEILKPVFSTNDKFLLSGNFGLPDTAVVQIINEKH